MADYTEEQFKEAARRALADGRPDIAKKLIARARAVGAAQTSIVDQAGSGINEGLAQGAGGVVDAANYVFNGLTNRPKVTGQMQIGDDGKPTFPDLRIEQGEGIQNPVGGSAHLTEMMDPLISDAAPQTGMQKFARRAGQELGANAIPALGLASKAAGGGNALSRVAGELGQSARKNMPSYLAGVTGGSVGSTAGGEAANAIDPGNQTLETAMRLGGGVLGGGLATAGASAAERASAIKKYIKSAPSSEKLKLDASSLYEKGHARGVVVQPNQTKALEAQIRAKASARGFISPTGRIADSAPEVRSALRLVEDMTQGPINTQQMQALRDQLQIVAQSQTPKVSAVGTQMIKEYDTFLARLAPEFKEANALYARAMRGEMMDRVDDLADIKASQFTQSGRENALRSEYRTLDRRIAKGLEKGLRPDQIEAVQTVSRGTPASNVARQVGKLAPTGAVSGAQHAFPYMVGASLGGPAAGFAAAGSTMGAGIAGRTLATAMQERAAQMASAAMRSANPIELGPTMSRAAAGGLLSTFLDEPTKKSKKRKPR